MLKIMRLICSVSFACLVTVSVFPQSAKPFSWSLGLQNVKTGELVSFLAPVQSSTGETYRLIINTGIDCFAYVIYESPNG